MVSPANIYAIDFTLYSDDGVISNTIEYKGKVRKLTNKEAAILREIVIREDSLKEYLKTRTYAEVFGVDAGSLPPVDVVATKPTSAAAGSNAKILLLVVGVAAALILFNK